ncbi:MAG TPA: DUF3311 domain-containing protein [Mycobacteriales bacterium]|jgi:hypothetical protein|nr:DUF3311 domain-containing protein [Mycobacteriales bacterium]
MAATPRPPDGAPVASGPRAESREVRKGWYVLLLVPILAPLLVSTYAHKTPELFGFPFFYWYQMIWIPISAVVTGAVYLLTTERGRR